VKAKQHGGSSNSGSADFIISGSIHKEGKGEEDGVSRPQEGDLRGGDMVDR